MIAKILIEQFEFACNNLHVTLLYLNFMYDVSGGRTVF